jgi:cyclopropane fatty-acyl-phospholipid synthase-like methyltransferase
MTPISNPLERWNARFSTPHYLFGESPNAYLRQMQPQLLPGKTLLLADGEGRNSVWLAQQGLELDAFDFSPVAVQKAQKLAEKNAVNVNFQCCNWESFDWAPQRYTNIVGVFFQFVNPEARAQLFSKIDQALKPGGILLIQGYGKEQMQFTSGGPGVLENLYDEALLCAAFAQYKVLDIRTYTEAISEGEGHSGMSALVGFLAQKR